MIVDHGLYKETLLRHYRQPHYKCDSALTDADVVRRGANPRCGDEIEVGLYLDGEVLREVKFRGRGCSVCIASASLMTEAVKGRTVAEAEDLFRRFHAMLTEDGEPDDLGKLEALAGVRQIPIRVKCATLAWHTLNAAMDGADDKVTTE